MKPIEMYALIGPGANTNLSTEARRAKEEGSPLRSRDIIYISQNHIMGTYTPNTPLP